MLFFNTTKSNWVKTITDDDLDETIDTLYEEIRELENERRTRREKV